MHKEFKITKKRLICITGFGFHFVTENGDFGFQIHKDSICLRNGFSSRYFYFMNKKLKMRLKLTGIEVIFGVSGFATLLFIVKTFNHSASLIAGVVVLYYSGYFARVFQEILIEKDYKKESMKSE